MPVRNGGQYLASAVASIRAQTSTDFELVIVDDHSTDQALRDLDGGDGRMTIVASQGRGVVSAFSTGARMARGQFIARMDSDDHVEPQWLEQQLALLARCPGVGIGACQTHIFRDDGPTGTGFALYEQWLNGLTQPDAIAREIFVESPLPNPGVVMRREVYERLGGYQDVAWPEDYDLWLRAWSAGVRMAKPEGVLLRWRDHGGRLTRTSDRYSKENFFQAKAHYLARTLLRDRPAIIWGAGETGALLCDLLVGEGATVSAFIDIDPRKLGGRKRERPVHGRDYLTVTNDCVIGAVAARGARNKIRAALTETGRREGEDFIMAA